MKTAFLYLLFCLIIPISGLAEKFTISGYVADSATGEKMIGAKVFDPNLKVGAITNAYGFYSLTIEASDSVQLTCTYIGYKPYIRMLKLDKDFNMNIQLAPLGLEMETVEIIGEETITESSQMSTIDVPIETIKRLPAILGEVDVIKTLQLLPGVQSGTEGSSGFYVRGGGPDQNLFLIDGVPVYNIAHLFNFFSVFNADAIKKVTLIKGGFPARYGGRLSSVVDISMKDGNMNEYHGDGSVSLIAAKAMVEGPIVKGKTSFMVSGRRTYIDLLTRPIIRAVTEGDGTGGYFFYDLNAKVNHIFSDKDRLYLSFYNGRDRFFARESYTDDWQGSRYRTDNRFSLSWGNTIAALRWNHVFGKRLFGNLTANFSDYNFAVKAEFEETEENSSGTFRDYALLKYVSGIQDFAGRMDFDWYASPNHLVRFGGYSIRHRFSPGATQFVLEGSSEIDTLLGNNKIIGIESGIYIEDEIKIGNRFKANLGVHASHFNVNQRNYWAIQPRASVRLLLSPKWSLKASYSEMAQYIHLLTNTNIGLPTDLWVPATDTIPAQEAWQAAIGVATTFLDDQFEFSIEAYYKEMENTITYKEGASFIDEEADFQKLVEVGEGSSYGVEFFLQKKKGRTTGWAGYTLSWTWRQFDNINNGNRYPFKYDRRHDFSLALAHEFSKEINVSLQWVYGSSYAFTLPIARAYGVYSNLDNLMGFFGEVEFNGERNSQRLRHYHRLDLGINWERVKKRVTSIWSFSIYNAYNRRNPFFFYFDEDIRTDTPVLKQVSLFPILPTIAYRIKF